MSHEITNRNGINAAVFTASTWHGLEELRGMETAADLIRAGEECFAFPTKISLEEMITSSGLVVPGSAVVAEYLNKERICHAAMGARYTQLDPVEWRATIEAAVAAGAKPAGAFALGLRGSKVLATFEIPGGNGGTSIRNYLNLIDSLDGSSAFVVGGTSIRTVCANTVAMSMAKDGAGMAKVRHTSSINEKADALREAIQLHVENGEKVAGLYRTARDTQLSRVEADTIFEMLFPSAKEGDSQRKATRKTNLRAAAARSMRREENSEGATLATMWNGATWMIDRDENGEARSARGGADRIESMLFGSRGKRVEEVRNIIEVVLADGSVEAMEVSEASALGVDDAQIGRKLMEDMFAAEKGNRPV